MVAVTEITKRLAILEKRLRINKPRIIVIAVPTEGGAITQATQDGLDKIERVLVVTNEDTVVRISYFGDSIAEPRLVSVH